MKQTLQRWTRLGCLLLIVAGAWPAHAFYNPTAGRWLSRDPIEEKGSLNLYGFVANDPIRNSDVLGLTVHLSPLNDIFVNASSYDVKIGGDWVEIEMWRSGGGTGSSFAYPWSTWEYGTTLNSIPSGVNFTIREPSGSHVLKPGHNSAADWHSGLTRIVDADFLTGASVPVYTDSSCQTLMKRWAKPTRWTHILPFALTVYDCKCKKAVYYTHGNEYH